MKWLKHGIQYRPDGVHPLMQSHAMIPTPVMLNDNAIRVFFSACDSNGVGRPAFIDVSAHDPKRVLASSGPLLDVGRPGCFDENGAVVTSVVPVTATRWHMYYVGFELGQKIRYRLLTGLAISNDGGETWQRHQETPILERSPEELFFRCGPYVTYDGARFRMWYVAGSEWIDINGKPMPVYDMRYMESSDGIHWPRHGEICLRISDLDEHGFGRPWVIQGPDGYELFYSIRRKSAGAYRLGYARSADGLNWVRNDAELGLDISADGFDSQAIMYSAILRCHGREWCFYNGNNFGSDGIGLAERTA